jgi:UDP-glucose 4-epimerase
VEAYVESAGLKGPSPAAPNGIYNVGTGKSVSVLELAQTIKQLARNEKDLVFLPERPGDIRHSLPVIDSIRKNLNWQPKMALKEGLWETLRWAETAVGE